MADTFTAQSFSGFEDRPVAIVTGACGGMGRAVCRRLGQDGYAIAATDMDPDALDSFVKELRSDGIAAAGLAFNLSDGGRITYFVDALPRIDVVANVAGVHSIKPFDELEADHFRFMNEVNVIALFELSQAAARRMEPGSSIVNIASRAWLGSANTAHYAASKAAVVGLTRSMSLDLANKRIRVNAIAPGIIDTPMIKRRSQSELEALEQQHPVGRIGTAEDIAGTLAFLVSADSGFIDGQVIVVDGGRSIGGPGT